MILAIDLEAIDPGYYVEPTATSEAIDYKDPCKAGEIFFPPFLVVRCVIYLIYVEVETCHESVLSELAGISPRFAFREMTVVDVVFKRFERT